MTQRFSKLAGVRFLPIRMCMMMFGTDLLGSQIFSEPQWEQLLPPPLSKEEQRPYTLLLSIDDLLVTSTWDVS